MEIETLNNASTQKIKELENNPILIRQFLWEQKRLARVDKVAIYKQYLFVLLKIYDGDKMEQLRRELRGGGDNSLFNLEKFIACDNDIFVYDEQEFNLLQLILQVIVLDCERKGGKKKIEDDGALIIACILLNSQRLDLTERQADILYSYKPILSLFLSLIDPQENRVSKEKRDQFLQGAVQSIEGVVLLISIIQGGSDMLKGVIDLSYIKLLDMCKNDKVKSRIQKYIQNDAIDKQIAQIIYQNKQAGDTSELYALLLCQTKQLDLLAIRLCSKYNIPNVGECIDSFLSKNINSISTQELKNIILQDLQSQQYRQGVYMIFLALKLQSIQYDINFLYSLPLSYFLDYLQQHSSSFSSIYQQFIILATQYASILFQAHLSFKRKSIPLQTAHQFQTIQNYLQLATFSHQQFGQQTLCFQKQLSYLFSRIIGDRKSWFNLFGISMTEVAARTLKWFVCESIGHKELQIAACSDPLHSESFLELLLCALEVILKNWEIFTDTSKASSKEKHSSYIFLLNVQVTQFLIECLSRDGEVPTKCDLLICEFVNDYGLSNSVMIDYIIKNGFSEENIWRAVQHIQWLQIGLSFWQKMLEKSENETFNLKFLTCLVCKYKSLQSCKIAESLLDCLKEKVGTEIDGRCVLAYIECLNSLRKGYPELKSKADQCYDKLKEKYISQAQSHFSLRPYHYIV